jgi:hypothetical protein
MQFLAAFIATHTGILSSIQSSCPRSQPSTRIECSSTTISNEIIQSFGDMLSPNHFRRRITRPVSYYALFEGIAASKPTSWLSQQFHLLFHSAYTLGP